MRGAVEAELGLGLSPRQADRTAGHTPTGQVVAFVPALVAVADIADPVVDFSAVPAGLLEIDTAEGGDRNGDVSAFGNVDADRARVVFRGNEIWIKDKYLFPVPPETGLRDPDVLKPIASDQSTVNGLHFEIESANIDELSRR